MAKGNDGVWLQDKVYRILSTRQSAAPGFVYRFPDSKAARNLISNQPGDHLWVQPNSPAILIECKSTSDSTPLKKMLSTSESKQQLGKHRIWHRAGGESIYVWADSRLQEFHIHDGRNVVAGRLTRPMDGMLPELEVVLLNVLETFTRSP